MPEPINIMEQRIRDGNPMRYDEFVELADLETTPTYADFMALHKAAERKVKKEMEIKNYEKN